MSASGSMLSMLPFHTHTLYFYLHLNSFTSTAYCYLCFYCMLLLYTSTLYFYFCTSTCISRMYRTAFIPAILSSAMLPYNRPGLSKKILHLCLRLIQQAPPQRSLTITWHTHEGCVTAISYNYTSYADSKTKMTPRFHVTFY